MDLVAEHRISDLARFGGVIRPAVAGPPPAGPLAPRVVERSPWP
jgi:hypothetical protein